MPTEVVPSILESTNKAHLLLIVASLTAILFLLSPSPALPYKLALDEAQKLQALLTAPGHLERHASLIVEQLPVGYLKGGWYEQLQIRLSNDGYDGARVDVDEIANLPDKYSQRLSSLTDVFSMLVEDPQLEITEPSEDNLYDFIKACRMEDATIVPFVTLIHNVDGGFLQCSFECGNKTEPLTCENKNIALSDWLKYTALHGALVQGDAGAGPLPNLSAVWPEVSSFGVSQAISYLNVAAVQKQQRMAIAGFDVSSGLVTNFVPIIILAIQIFIVCNLSWLDTFTRRKPEYMPSSWWLLFPQISSRIVALTTLGLAPVTICSVIYYKGNAFSYTTDSSWIEFVAPISVSILALALGASSLFYLFKLSRRFYPPAGERYLST